MLSRILVALALAAAVVSGGAIAFLRTDFVANNLCAYAVATIEEASAAQVRVAGCSVDPARGQLTIDGLRVGDPGGRIDLTIARVFVQVVVRPLLQRVRLERLEIDHPELHLALDVQSAPTARARRQECLPDILDRFELGRVTIRKASVDVRRAGVHVVVPRANVSIHGKDEVMEVEVITRDRSSTYAQAATSAAPQARQVADRWHLLKNLREAVEGMFGRLSTLVRSALTEPPQPVATADAS